MHPLTRAAGPSSGPIWLEADGRRLEPVPLGPHEVLFRCRLPLDRLVLCSAAARPAQLGLGPDQRLLGVQVLGLAWEQGSASFVPRLDQPDCGHGFHDLEQGQYRWTDGRATFAAGLVPAWQGESRLRIQAVPLLRAAMAVPAMPAPAAELLRGFESLGEDCEFGFVQKHYDTTLPLGLFRWASTDLARLIEGLDNGFAGIAEPENLVISEGETDWRLQSRYARLHTFHAQNPTADPDWRHRNALLLGLLRRKLMRELAEGTRFFVFKSAAIGFGPAEMRSLHAAIARRGPAPLLCVTQGPAAGQVERIAPGLYHGQVSRFVLGAGPYEEWLTLCRKARALHDA